MIKGPVYSKELIVRDTGSITGSIEADDVEIHGHLDGKVVAQNIVIGPQEQLKETSNLEAILEPKMELILTVISKNKYQNLN